MSYRRGSTRRYRLPTITIGDKMIVNDDIDDMIGSQMVSLQEGQEMTAASLPLRGWMDVTDRNGEKYTLAYPSHVRKWFPPRRYGGKRTKRRCHTHKKSRKRHCRK
jgi:hypothetical protein